MRYTTDTYEIVFDVIANITDNSVIATRTEECHGYHTFEDVKTEYIVNRVYISVGNEFIDITDRLTDAEKELITENQNL